ncbi:Fic family protein [Flavobacterium sp. MC2016-06]|jgi:Fic family protein|uniref:Fic family protein n=1 Tax=Flavobacterium sp. MC2016-06 TaxID=2676308 RepID=UPI00209A8EC5|nr:Fic family protein [Flavobacterium sp. MC2016-06]
MQEHLEAINFQETITHIKDLNQKKSALNEKEFLAIHHLIFRGIKPENLGKYKNDPLVIREMNLFFNWYETHKNKLHPIILAAEAHLKILNIDPFENGTIQIANLILNWILLQNNYTYVVIEDSQDSIDEYFFILEDSQNKNDNSIFINYILQIEKENLIRAIKLVSK